MSCNPEKARSLGEIGENLAEQLLLKAGFQDVRRLRRNHRDADFLATENGKKYFISVKARSKWTAEGKVNGRYKLESKTRKIQDALATAAEYEAEYAWLTIQVAPRTLSAYFGTYAELLNLTRNVGRAATGVLMTDQYTQRYRRLAIDAPHQFEYSLICNPAPA